MSTTYPASLRPAAPEMAEIAAKLLYLTMGPLATYWMGVDSEQPAQRILKRMFGAGRHLFSHQYATVADVGGEVAGLELSYPAPWMKSLEAGTLLRFLIVAGPMNAIRMVWRSYPLQSITEAAADDYFLAHLGVLPQFEGRGLGRQLLERTEMRAVTAGARRITLTVDAENARAIRLYERAGFVVTASVSFEPLRQRFNYHGFHHMSKELR